MTDVATSHLTEYELRPARGGWPFIRLVVADWETAQWVPPPGREPTGRVQWYRRPLGRRRWFKAGEPFYFHRPT